MRRFWWVAILVTGCGTGSIDDACEEIATTQCAQCYACGEDGAALCGAASGADESACVTELATRCGDQSATVEEPKARLEACQDSLDELSCELLLGAFAQGGPISTDACEYFL